MMSKLPIGIQSFERLRKEGYLYIDKTGYIQKLADAGSVYFLSRPRRFGKSLLVSTMEAYFRGQKELFQGLAIEEWENRKPEQERWVEYPVLKFSLSGGFYGTDDGLEQILAYTLRSFEEEYKIPQFEELWKKQYGVADFERTAEKQNGALNLRATLPVWLKYCIEKAYGLTGKPVVFLCDEYDKPLLENISVDAEQEERNRSLFKSFFSILKDEDRYLKFVFITGVTKFSKISIFSDLNQLKDISLLPKYSAICGITEQEMCESLSGELDSMAESLGMSREETSLELARMYDGYHFSAGGEGVYNPFSLLNALTDGNCGRYWFETGTPTYLVNALRHSGMPVSDLSSGITATEGRISSFRADDTDMVPLYYQSGYLTIAGYDRKFRTYTLSFPNDEVKYGFLESLIPMASPAYRVADSAFSAQRMTEYLQDGSREAIDAFMTMLQALLASIPYHEGKAPADEQQWRNVVYAVFAVLGQYVKAEVHSALGRSDCVVENNQYVYIFEFKHDKTAAEALKQINENGYAAPYASCGKKIVKVGANFSTAKRTLDRWEVQE